MVLRRGRTLSPINAVKHYVPATNSLTTSGSVRNQTVALAVPNTALPVNAGDVKEGSVIKAIFLEYWCGGAGATGADTQFSLAFYKQQGGTNAMVAADLLNPGAYDNKKNIIFFSQGVIMGSDTQAVPLLRQWFKIPKGKQRMGLGDIWKVGMTPTGESINNCGFATYKEYQ